MADTYMELSGDNTMTSSWGHCHRVLLLWPSVSGADVRHSLAHSEPPSVLTLFLPHC